METEPSHQPDELGADLPIQFSGQSSAVATAQFPDRSADQRAIPVVFDEQSGLLRRDGEREKLPVFEFGLRDYGRHTLAPGRGYPDSGRRLEPATAADFELHRLRRDGD